VTQPEQERDQVSGIIIHVDWSAVASTPTEHINQFIVQVGPPTQDGSPDGIYMAFGHLPPPVIVSDDPEMQAREIEAVKAGVPIEIRGRFHMNRARLDELIKVLQKTAENYDRAAEIYRQRAQAEEKP
jgi:hypothetical protein